MCYPASSPDRIYLWLQQPPSPKPVGQPDGIAIATCSLEANNAGGGANTTITVVTRRGTVEGEETKFTRRYAVWIVSSPPRGSSDSRGAGTISSIKTLVELPGSSPASKHGRPVLPHSELKAVMAP